MKLAYYPGCVSKSTGKEMDASTRAVCAALGIELEELEDWNCCGATHVSNELVATGLAARNMAQTDLDIMTACSICYSNLRAAAQRLEETRDPGEGERRPGQEVQRRQDPACSGRHFRGLGRER